MFFEKFLFTNSNLGTIGVPQTAIFGSGSPDSTKNSQEMAKRKRKIQQSGRGKVRDGVRRSKMYLGKV